MKIKDLPRIERPREKLEKYGPEKLSDAELLAILLRTGNRHLNVLQMAEKVLKKFFQQQLAQAEYAELKKISGLGQTKACEIVACFELGRRFLQNKKAVLLLSPKEVWENLRDIRSSKKEHFVVFFLDARQQEIEREIISIGTLNANLVHPREVFESAIKCSAAQIIVAHNHPSGHVQPSTEDIELTKRLSQAGILMGIELIDHVVVSQEEYFSFKAEGLM